MILGNTSLKTSYDAEIAHHYVTVNIQSSTFHHKVHIKRHSMHTAGSLSIHLTTAEEMVVMKAKTEAALMELRSQRRTRDSEEAKLGLVNLKLMLKTWKDLTHENRNDASMFSHCAIMIHEYDAKVAQQESDYVDWVKNMATLKHALTRSELGFRPMNLNNTIHSPQLLEHLTKISTTPFTVLSSLPLPHLLLIRQHRHQRLLCVPKKEFSRFRQARFQQTTGFHSK
jgi:hypothetical protein